MRAQDAYKMQRRPPWWTVPNGPQTQKDTKMRLLYVFAGILAFSVAESEYENKHYEDLEAVESIELQKTHDLKSAASVYSSVPYPAWNQPQPTWTQTHPNQPPFVQPTPPPYVPGFTTGPVQSDYIPPQNPPHYYYPTTTTPVPVIKNEHTIGDNGSYKYEYQIADGTWVGEQGYFTNPKQTDESLVKKGWYQYIGADGKTYTVTYWADHTGYHAYGDHLPTPPPIPPAIQAAIDQNAKEEAAKAEAEKNKPYYPTTQKPIYYDPPQQPQQPYYPPQQPQQPYYPPQQPYYPPQQTQQPYYPPQTNYPTGK